MFSKLREGNVSSRVWDASGMLEHVYLGTPSTVPIPPPDLFKLCSPYKRATGGLHSIEITSCLSGVFEHFLVRYQAE